MPIWTRTALLPLVLALGLAAGCDEDEKVVEFSGTEICNDVEQVLVHRSVGEEARVQLPLDSLRELRPVPPHDLHAREHDGRLAVAPDESHVPLARARCPVVLGSATPSLTSRRNLPSGPPVVTVGPG